MSSSSSSFSHESSFTSDFTEDDTTESSTRSSSSSSSSSSLSSSQSSTHTRSSKSIRKPNKSDEDFSKLIEIIRKNTNKSQRKPLETDKYQIQRLIKRVKINENKPEMSTTRNKVKNPIDKVKIDEMIVNRLKTENEIERIKQEQMQKISLFGNELVPLNNHFGLEMANRENRDRAFYYKDKCRQIYAKRYLG